MHVSRGPVKAYEVRLTACGMLSYWQTRTCIRCLNRQGFAHLLQQANIVVENKLEFEFRTDMMIWIGRLTTLLTLPMPITAVNVCLLKWLSVRRIRVSTLGSDQLYIGLVTSFQSPLCCLRLYRAMKFDVICKSIDFEVTRCFLALEMGREIARETFRTELLSVHCRYPA